MTAGTCSATVTVVGIGTFTCDLGPRHRLHSARLPSAGEWVSVSWAGDTATIAPPGSHRPRP